jgi:heat shock protein HslJ
VRSIVVLAAVLLLVACGDGDEGGTAPPAPVRGEWQLAEGTADGAALLVPPGIGATLLLDDGEATGRSFCNHYMATYTSDGEALTFDGIGGTEMGCDPDVMAAESAYLRALGSVQKARVDGEGLVLSGDGVELRFVPVAPVPDSPLEGTRWVLDTLIDGETASTTLGEPAVLQLDPDRTVTASTGCRSVTGTWLLEDDALVIDDLLAGAEPCPPDVATQDEHVVAVLESGPQVEIVEDRLTLTGSAGRGLSYRAKVR